MCLNVSAVKHDVLSHRGSKPCCHPIKTSGCDVRKMSRHVDTCQQKIRFEPVLRKRKLCFLWKHSKRSGRQVGNTQNNCQNYNYRVLARASRHVKKLKDLSIYLVAGQTRAITVNSEFETLNCFHNLFYFRFETPVKSSYLSRLAKKRVRGQLRQSSDELQSDSS